MKRIFAALLACCLSPLALAQEAGLIATLNSNAPVQEKAAACRELARVGTKLAVPALASLLADEQLSHMARYALEPIADPSADAALRDALHRVKGRLLIGVIGSLGVRKDAKAVEPLTRYLADADPAVAEAAARALGSIGSRPPPPRSAGVPPATATRSAGVPPATAALLRALLTTSSANRPAVCEGLFRCAEAMSGAAATAIYDKVLAQKDLPPHVHLAALSGAIRSRGRKGVPLLIQTIRTGPYESAACAMQISMSIPGKDLTRALARELTSADGATQILLAQTLGERGDATAAPALTRLAMAGSADLRIAAIRSLAQLGSPSSLPALVAAARDADANVAVGARAALVGFPGKEADAAVAAMLGDPSPATRIAAAEVAVQRRLTAATPALLKAARDPDSAVAEAGFRALGELGSVAEIQAIVDAMLGSRNVVAAEAALSAICARQPDPTVCAEQVLPGYAKAQGDVRAALLRVLGVAAGPQALATVRAATQGADEVTRDVAFRVLFDWPDAGALPDLSRIASTTVDAKTRLLALRGQLRLVSLKTVPDAQKLETIEQALPLIERKEELTQALAVLGETPSAPSLALVVPHLTDGEAREEAGLAAVAIADRIVPDHPADVAEAMSLVQTNDPALATRARQLRDRAAIGATGAGYLPIFNGKDLTGWEGKPGWWTVEDGALTAESTPEKPCTECNYLVWRGGTPADFELRAGFKLSLAGNSGIQIRSEDRPNWDTFGYQADMTGDGALVGFVYHHSRGLIAGRGERVVFAADGAKTAEPIGDAAKLLAHFRPGDWNTYRVV
ncbi:MAG: DUF1080 domain-containing protein, partial [Armatimonadetes bacterium]|nr:DUF1080 domain-containing protein [Armatimonadota bacterium]